MDRRMVAGALALGLWAGTAAAQDFRVVPDDGWCARDGHDDDDRAKHCELREASWGASNSLRVDAAPNGGVKVWAWDKDQVRVLAKVVAMAEDDAEARRMSSEIRLTGGARVSAEGPGASRRRHWSVSYHVWVPARIDLDLASMNGGIALEGVRGRTEFETLNGGVNIVNGGGALRGRTTNGGVKVDLSGSRWDGEGLDVTTTNGGVVLSVPDEYNAHLVTGTVNGRIDLGFPVRVQGRLDRQITTDLGSGGPTIRAMTTNGGVVVRRR
jgi:hypothetical protein